MIRRLVKIITLVMMLVIMTSCSKPGITTNPSSFQDAMKTSKGKRVTFYGWGGNPAINQWLDEVVTLTLKQKYDITLNRVPMDINEVLNKLTTEKHAGVEKGDIDVVWINGENFYTAKKNDLLYGPIIDKVENYSKYIDAEAPDTKFDFGNPIDGMEIPYGKAQLVFITDTGKVRDLPTSAQKLLELAKTNKGKITYPAPPDFVGSAFVRNIIYEVAGFEAINNAKADLDELYEAAKPGFDYMNELEEYLWQEGRTYPGDSAALDKMFSDGQLLMTMSYTPLYAAQKISDALFPQTSATFVFDKGNIGNTHYVAIPYNSPNKDAALVLVNHIISVEMQASKYDIKNWGDLPVLDMNRLNDDEKAVFNKMDNGKGILAPEELLKKRKPEIQAEKVSKIEKLWYEKVLKNQ